jgi:polyribonucleotide nucleotidyltransferase
MKPTGTVQQIDLGDGRTITLETGRLAKQAHGACWLTMGKTKMLATVVSNEEAKEGIDFLPLTVEYREKFSAVGKFPGGFFKREARPAEAQILVARLIDRALRPLFPSDYHSDTQVMVTLYSLEENTYPDALACLAASAALTVSDIPFAGPVSEVRVGRVDGAWKINPSREETDATDVDMMIAATLDNIMMLEGEMSEISEAEMLEAIKVAHEAIKVQCQAQLDLAADFGKPETREYNHEDNDPELEAKVMEACYSDVYEVVKQALTNKKKRKEAFGEVRDRFMEGYSEEELEEKGDLIKKYFHKVEKKAMRDLVLQERYRLDGRKLDEIRPIWIDLDPLPAAHGSAVFTRGETQSLTSVTLGNKMDEQTIDTPVFNTSEKFLLHYNFPSFSTGESRPIRATSRREIGHGNLALRALKRMVPESCPYTVRIISDILESNGSSSMATVCAGSLAMMDAGIQTPKAVSGIAMGLIWDAETRNYAVLSDILGDEDHLGDMDFKVTGTKDGITACQMDIKIDGLDYQVLEEALAQAKAGREHILGEMAKAIDSPRPDYKEHAPRMVQIRIPKEFIGAIIGPGGKIIQEMQAETNTNIVIDEDEQSGIVDIMAADKASIDAALARIKGITQMAEVGEEYEATVKSIKPYGAFVEFLPGREGLLHISEVAWERIETLEDVMNPGDKIKVKLLEVDPVTGKFRLSRKALLDKPEGWVDRPPRGDRGGDRGDRGGRDRGPRRDRGDRGDRGGRGGRDRGPRDDRGGDRGPRRPDPVGE